MLIDSEDPAAGERMCDGCREEAFAGVPLDEDPHDDPDGPMIDAEVAELGEDTPNLHAVH